MENEATDIKTYYEQKILNQIQYKSIEHKLSVDYYESLFDKVLSDEIYRILDTSLEWSNSKRNKYLFGELGLIYTVAYRGNKSHYEVEPWTSVKYLTNLKSIAEGITGEIYNVCVIQRYPNGAIGINPHKDKEMIQGTTICGFSFGAVRTINLTAPKYMNIKDVSINLAHGSLYVLNPPTNTYWTHEITKNKSISNSRISLTFRNYSPNK
jgi:alpha-ketoglutarate-dependent dioxygenase alkB family protein 2